MKVNSFRIQEEKDREYLAINLEAETQAESALMITALNRFPNAVRSFGKVSPSHTWAWIMIPLNKSNYKADYFGNDKS